MNQLLKLLLLFVMSFSIAHEVVISSQSHCSAKEYVSEFSAPVYHSVEHDEHKNDICNTHFMFHISFLLPDTFSLLRVNKKIFIIDSELLTYTNTFPNNTFRPPIV